MNDVLDDVVVAPVNVPAYSPTAVQEGEVFLDRLYLPDTKNLKDYEDIVACFKENAAPVESFPIQHDLWGGVYCRTLFLKEGRSVVGCRHKVDSQLMIHGDCLVTTEKGIERVRGFAMLQTPAGTWRAVEALTDVILMAIFATPYTSLENLTKIQQDTIHSPEDIQANCMPLQRAKA